MSRELNIKFKLAALLNAIEDPVPLQAKELLEEKDSQNNASPKPKRCQMVDCKGKLGLTDNACKCSRFYCSKHRHAETHSCTFDYKSEGIDKLKKLLPVVRGVKVDNI